MKEALRAVAGLQDFATTFRYPTDTVHRIKPTPSQSQFQAHVDRVEALLAEAVRRFEVDLASPTTEAARVAPPRGP